ncbi:MAG: hypothetical protein PHE06_15100 [Lachnospiraceae bacterium]|nr:hypothetical protein [Lachnospiraceae bacterium]
MRACRQIKNRLIHFYSGYDSYLTAALKFFAAFAVLFYLSVSMGYLTVLNQILIIFIVAACCSFLPGNALILAGTVFLEGHFYGYSLSTAICGGILLLILLLLYFCFLPGQSYVVVLTALALALHIPCMVPVVCGLMLGAGAFAGIAMGTGVYFLAYGLCLKPAVQEGLGEAMLNHILQSFQQVLVNQDMFLALVILAAAFFVVYLIRRLPVNYSWHTAIVSGIVVYLLLSVMGPLLLGTKLNIGLLALDVLIAAGTGLILLFFCFSLDYGRIEYLQFEDDEYYYYVKAIPKMEMDETDSLAKKETIKNE